MDYISPFLQEDLYFSMIFQKLWQGGFTLWWSFSYSKLQHCEIWKKVNYTLNHTAMESFLYYCKGNIVWKPETETDMCVCQTGLVKRIYLSCCLRTMHSTIFKNVFLVTTFLRLTTKLLKNPLTKHWISSYNE